MKVIGLTGGIGSGKSTVSGLLRKQGAIIIDADIIAREVVEKGKDAYNEIIDAFGLNILDDQGNIDRAKLGSIVFNDKKKLDLLSEITHKHVIKEIINELEQIKKSSFDGIVVIDAPIPVKHGFLDVSDEVWVVHSNEEIRIKRIMERNNLDRKQAEIRIKSQMSEKEYLELADKVIVNEGSINNLEQKINDLLKLIVN